MRTNVTVCDMMLCCAQALALSASSLEPTGINTAFNLATSGVLGQLVFSETLNVGWWCGISLVITGTILVQRGQTQVDDVITHKKEM